jgi:preprotein translocase subunit SecA
LFVSRMLMAIERRAAARLALDSAALAALDWPQLESAILDAVARSLDDRLQALDQPSGQVRYNIDAFLKSSDERGDQSPDLAELAASMAVGTQAAIDAATKQRVSRRVAILNYIHLTAGQLAARAPQDISEDILAHLEAVQQKLRFIWGKMELQRLVRDDAGFDSLPTDYQTSIRQQLSPDTWEVLSRGGFQSLLEGNDRGAISAFGRGIQNVIYRHILLRSISDLWIEHLTQMEGLRVSIRMEAYAQRDPLVEYKSLSTDRFKDLMGAIRMGVISKMFRLQPAAPQSPIPEAPPAPEKTPVKQAESGDAKKKRKRHKKK